MSGVTEHESSPRCNCWRCCAARVRLRCNLPLDVPLCKNHPWMEECGCGGGKILLPAEILAAVMPPSGAPHD